MLTSSNFSIISLINSQCSSKSEDLKSITPTHMNSNMNKGNDGHIIATCMHYKHMHDGLWTYINHPKIRKIYHNMILD